MYYIAHRLFAAHDRALGAQLASTLAAQVGPDQVFLPFCDTDEEDLVAPVKGRRLFDLDTQRLASLDGMIAVLHGPSLDDGVCMEIGYAAALGVPVVVITTDFQTYGFTESGPRLAFCDPLIEILAAEVVRVDRLGPPPLETGNRFEAFGQRNRDQLSAALGLAVDRILAVPPPPIAPTVEATRTSVVFYEPSPYADPGAAEAARRGLADLGYTVTVASRADAADPPKAAAADWTALSGSGLLVADTAGPECPPGAALLIGGSVAANRPIWAVQPQNTWTFAHGREPNWRNLMIQYSLSARLTGISDIEPIVVRWN